MARQSYYTDIVSKILAAKLCAKANLICSLKQLLLHLHIAEGLTLLAACCRKAIIVLCRGKFYGLQVGFCRGASNNKCNVIWRAGCCAKCLHLLDEEVLQLARCEQSLCLLIKIGLVCRTAALCNKEELVLIAIHCVEVYLSRHIVAGVLLLEHIKRKGL